MRTTHYMDGRWFHSQNTTTANFIGLIGVKSIATTKRSGAFFRICCQRMHSGKLVFFCRHIAVLNFERGTVPARVGVYCPG